MEKQNVVVVVVVCVCVCVCVCVILTHAATWMNLEDVMVSEISQSRSEKQQQILYDSSSMRYLE